MGRHDIELDELEALIAHSTYRGSLDTAPLKAIPIDAVLPQLPSRYRIERLVGQGGMGYVYEAFDEQLRRRVAVKVASQSRRVLLDSLNREAIVLAALQHPNIVTIHDSGTLPGGEPFCVMQFVKGEPLHKYCERQQLDTRAKVKLLAEIAATVGAAHSVGIVHRDLKPQNILVTNEVRPMVLDFGLATGLAISRDAADRIPASTGLTGAAGTPEFMSPEQAAGLQVDARSDVFALGITLRRLLPSQVPKDLMAVVARCTNSNPDARYANANRLADDLNEWLAGRPVEALRHSHLYRASKFVTRNWLPIGLATAATVIVAAGVTADLVRVRRERDRTEVQRNVAERHYQRAKRAVKSYLMEVTQDPELADEGRQELRARLLDRARGFYEELLSESTADPDLQVEQAEALSSLATIAGSIETREKAITLLHQAVESLAQAVAEHPERQDWRLELATTRIQYAEQLETVGRFDESNAELRAAVQLVGDLEGDEASRVMADAHAAMGWTHQMNRRQVDASAEYETSLGLLRRLVAEAGETRDRSMLGTILMRLGTMRLILRQRDQARQLLNESLELRQQLVAESPHNPEYRYLLANSHERLAHLELAEKNWTEAERQEQAALSLFDALVHDFPAVTTYRHYAAKNRMDFGAVLRRGGHLAEAEAMLTSARADLDLLVTSQPGVIRWQADLAEVLMELGSCYRDRSQPGEAAELYKTAIEALEDLDADHPTFVRLSTRLARAYAAMAALSNPGQPESTPNLTSQPQ